MTGENLFKKPLFSIHLFVCNKNLLKRKMQCFGQDSEIMGHFDLLPVKARGHFPFKAANENKI